MDTVFQKMIEAQCGAFTKQLNAFMHLTHSKPRRVECRSCKAYRAQCVKNGRSTGIDSDSSIVSELEELVSDIDSSSGSSSGSSSSSSSGSGSSSSSGESETTSDIAAVCSRPRHPCTMPRRYTTSANYDCDCERDDRGDAIYSDITDIKREICLLNDKLSEVMSKVNGMPRQYTLPEETIHQHDRIPSVTSASASLTEPGVNTLRESVATILSASTIVADPTILAASTSIMAADSGVKKTLRESVAAVLSAASIATIVSPPCGVAPSCDSDNDIMDDMGQSVYDEAEVNEAESEDDAEAESEVNEAEAEAEDEVVELPVTTISDPIVAQVVTEPDDDEELFEEVVNGYMCFVTADKQNGAIYESVDGDGAGSGEPGDKIGYFQAGIAVFTVNMEDEDEEHEDEDEPLIEAAKPVVDETEEEELYEETVSGYICFVTADKQNGAIYESVVSEDDPSAESEPGDQIGHFKDGVAIFTVEMD